MKRSGVTNLPLHGGKAPSWLVDRMIELAEPIVKIIVNEYGQETLLKRLSDPYWFQALGCVLGYDWHSSGLTTVTTGVLKEAMDPEEIGVFTAGGKGKVSLKTPNEIENFSKKFGFQGNEIDDLKKASRMTAKVDNTAIQAKAPLYHHTIFCSKDGDWTVIQQGMNTDKGIARRYHWLSKEVKNFVKEPHQGIIVEKPETSVLDMTAKESKDCRKTSTDLVKEGSEKLKNDFETLTPKNQKTLTDWISGSNKLKSKISHLDLPKRMNWKALEKTYELQPENYGEILEIKGIGPSTVRGLALISELIYDESASRQDPAKFSFAFGGKDGVPYPVDRKAMDEANKTLRNALEGAEIERKKKLKAIKRLSDFSKREKNANKDNNDL